MASLDEINILDYRPLTPKQLLEVGRKDTVEPVPPTPIQDFLMYDVLNPSGRKLVQTLKGELDNPLNYLAGGSGKAVALIGHNRGPKLFDKGTGSVVSDDVADKMFDVDIELDALYDLRKRKARIEDKIGYQGMFDNPQLSPKQERLFEQEIEALDDMIGKIQTKAEKKIQKRFETNIASRTIPELDPRVVDRPSKKTIEDTALGQANKSIIANTTDFVDSPGFNTFYGSTYGGEKFRSGLYQLFDDQVTKSGRLLDYSDPLYNRKYTDLFAYDTRTKMTPQGIASLNPLEVFEKGRSLPVTMKIGEQNHFYVDPKKLASKLDRSEAGEDFFKLRESEMDYLDNLNERILTEGYKPRPVQIGINPSGNATIYEGNHRLARALEMGDEEIPVSFQYLAGAERLDTPFGINELDSFLAQGAKGFKNADEKAKYIKDVEKKYDKFKGK